MVKSAQLADPLSRCGWRSLPQAAARKSVVAERVSHLRCKVPRRPVTVSAL